MERNLRENGTRETLIRYYGRIIEHITITDPKIQNILITSAEPDEGRTTTALGLALSSAILKPNKQILLVDLDLRHSMLHRMLGLGDTSGIREVFGNTLNIGDVLRNTHLTNLKVIPGGKEAVDFPEVFQSKALVQFLKEVKSRYDLAFYDSPAIKNHVDGHILSSLMDGVLLVVRSDRSKRDEVVAAREEINSGGGKVIGAIMNDFRNPIPSFLYRRL
jgi:capsular exopolysaccharide synthesis family protein